MPELLKKLLKPFLVVPLAFFLCMPLGVFAQDAVTVSKAFAGLFGDPMLDSLITNALSNNKNVLQALDRIAAAKATKRVAAASYYPDVTINASWERDRASAALNATGRPVYANTGYLGASTSWEIDVFGSIRNDVKSKKDLYKVSIENFNWTMISLCAEVASSYVTLRTYQQQYLVTQENIVSQKRIYDITVARYNAGLASKLDVLQAKSVYQTSQAQLPALEAEIIQQINSIYILLGAAPEGYTNYAQGNIQSVDILDGAIYKKSPLWSIRPIPVVNIEEVVNIGLDAILNRPDIKAEEFTVNSMAALVGASKADWFPQFFLKASIGYADGNFKRIFKEPKMEFTINPSISWTLFSGRQVQENTKLAKANWEEAVNAFNLAIITAMQEVDNAIALYAAYSAQVDDYRAVRDEGVEVLRLSLELYKMGLQNFTTVLDAQRSL